MAQSLPARTCRDIFRPQFPADICALASVNILERLRANSPLMRAAQALLCAMFLFNLAAHVSHRHESKPSVSSERLICPYCCTFAAVIGPAEPVAIPPMAAPFSTLVAAPAEGCFQPHTVIAQWARGPPDIYPALSQSFS